MRVFPCARTYEDLEKEKLTMVVSLTAKRGSIRSYAGTYRRDAVDEAVRFLFNALAFVFLRSTSDGRVRGKDTRRWFLYASCL